MKTYVLPSVFVLVFATSACSSETSTPPPKTSEAPKSVQTAEVQTVSPLARGEKLYKRCVTCHTLEAGGRHKVGPNLHGIYGATAGTKEGYAYSKAMAASEIIWTDETLSAYIENPSKYVPKGKMSYAGLRKPEDREALLAFLKEATK